MSIKRLYKSKKDKIIFGVCGGIAEYLGIDPSLIRLLWILAGCIFGSGVLAYLIFAVVVPYKREK
jgi:phage shock protein C